MKKVAVIQDLSSFGKCSLTAAIPVLSVMGVQACPLPTAVLSAQTGYPSYFWDDFTPKMNHFTEEWNKLQVMFDGIFTGFVTGGEQIKNIFYFLDRFYINDTKLLVDPVMGDDGEVYPIFTGGLLEQMKALVRHADVITPNVTECCLLSGLSYEKLHSYSDGNDYLKALEEAGNRLTQTSGAEVIITGVNPPAAEPTKQFIGNLYLDGNKTFYHEMEYNRKSYSGTGDLFASVVMGSMMRGDSLEGAVQLAVGFLKEAIQDASKEKVPEIEGVNFEKYLGMLI
ncbi:pyridoxamine kinase [Oceanobacillus sp. FSL H7-0719]|uniref:pyridoxamine kinase n=1 Tax=Oceanobacillus sp. FSL H7-0719 TaxID=2954507 RepID=UPI0032545EB5